MPFTAIDIDKLKSAIATGALRVRYADREATYRSLDEMRQTLRIMQDDIAAAAGKRPRRRRATHFLTSKGL